jgi:hypothetical protein
MSIVIFFHVNLGIPENDIANPWILSHPENILVPWGSLKRGQILGRCQRRKDAHTRL